MSKQIKEGASGALYKETIQCLRTEDLPSVTLAPFSQHYLPKVRDCEELLTECMIDLATKHGRNDYCKIPALLQREVFQANHKRVERIWLV